MSFGESVFSAGFIQKTAKGDLFVKGNHVIPQRNRHEKTLKDTRRQPTKVDPKSMTCGAGQPHLQVGQPSDPTCQPLFRILVFHRLLDCIYTVLLSQFDPRV
jgi:hypothetical protein